MGMNVMDLISSCQWRAGRKHLATYAEDHGFLPYDPTLMTALLLYAYSPGLYASRRIAKACQERMNFMAVTARQSPDFRTISDFRKRHLPALGGLFTQVLQLGQQTGLVDRKSVV